jgi:hypothetical protein
MVGNFTDPPNPKSPRTLVGGFTQESLRTRGAVPLHEYKGTPPSKEFVPLVQHQSQLDRLLERIARRICAVQNECRTTDGYCDLHWKDFLPAATAAHDVISELIMGATL